jgi:hypothetical protein
MPALIASLLLMQAAPSSPASAVSPAIQAYREACIEGSFKLSPARGRVLKPSEPYNFLDYLAYPESISHRTIVKLSEPPSTYLILTEYKQLQPGSIARTCALDSSSVSRREAMGAFLEGLPDKDVSPRWIPDMYEPIWTVNHPELGYSKQFRYREDGSTVLEIGMYPTSAAQMNAGTTKQ